MVSKALLLILFPVVSFGKLNLEAPIGGMTGFLKAKHPIELATGELELENKTTFCRMNFAETASVKISGGTELSIVKGKDLIAVLAAEENNVVLKNRKGKFFLIKCTTYGKSKVSINEMMSVFSKHFDFYVSARTVVVD